MPLARTDGLVVEELPGELLIYDPLYNRAHCLGGTAASVWRLSDGTTSIGAICEKLELDKDTVGLALEELQNSQLLQATPRLGSTRREVTIKTAKFGSVAVAAPLIWSIAGPIPEAFATPTPAQCEFYTDTSCDACTAICGCCCCCQGSGTANHTPSCKLCYPSHLCASFICPANPTPVVTCPDNACGHCSTTPPDNPPGCTPAGASFTCKKGGTSPCCTY